MGDTTAPIRSAPPPSPQIPSVRRDKIEETAKEFEAVMLGQFAKMMMDTVDKGKEFSGGHGEEMFTGILAEKIGQEMANKGGIGISQAVRDQMIRMQEGSE